MNCLCGEKLKISEKSKRELKTCGDKRCIEELRNIGFRKKLEGKVNKEFIETRLLTKSGKLNHNLTKLLDYTINELYNIYYGLDTQYCNCGKEKHFLRSKQVTDKLAVIHVVQII